MTVQPREIGSLQRAKATRGTPRVALGTTHPPPRSVRVINNPEPGEVYELLASWAANSSLHQFLEARVLAERIEVGVDLASPAGDLAGLRRPREALDWALGLRTVAFFARLLQGPASSAPELHTASMASSVSSGGTPKSACPHPARARGDLAPSRSSVPSDRR